MRKKKTTTEFIAEANIIHNKKYTYTKPYIHSRQKIGISCPTHGLFFQYPYSHLSGSGCKQCDISSRAHQSTYSHTTFLEKANEKHNHKYMYTGTYIHSNKLLNIECPIHGEFNQKPYVHLLGHGCKKCADGDRTGGYHTQWFEDDSSRYDLLGTFYILDVTFPESFFKIGITQNLQQRLTHYPKTLQYKVLTSIDVVLYTAFIAEQQIITTHKDYRYFPNVLFGGHTECFKKSLPVKQILQEQFRSQ